MDRTGHWLIDGINLNTPRKRKSGQNRTLNDGWHQFEHPEKAKVDRTGHWMIDGINLNTPRKSNSGENRTSIDWMIDGVSLNTPRQEVIHGIIRKGWEQRIAFHQIHVNNKRWLLDPGKNEELRWRGDWILFGRLKIKKDVSSIAPCSTVKELSSKCLVWKEKKTFRA